MEWKEMLAELGTERIESKTTIEHHNNLRRDPPDSQNSGCPMHCELLVCTDHVGQSRLPLWTRFNTQT
jgi:hypothetical protein